MNKVYACVDGRANSAAVTDWAAWSAQRLDVPLELLHVLERHPERAALSDYSGAIGLDAQAALLAQLSELDEQRSRLAQEAGRRLLAAARERAGAGGAVRVDARLRHGELVDTVLEMEPDARLFVLGEHHHARPGARLHLDHHVERVVRSVKRPVLVIPGEEFSPPQRFLIGFDGSATARKAVEMVAGSPMLAGLPALLAMIGDDTATARELLAAARHTLTDAGFEADVALEPGEPEKALARIAQGHGASLIVMGAYGHSRIRQLIAGSTTTTLLRISELPVLILR